MSTLIYNVKYRPVRLGWCVREGDIPSLISAFRLSHCLWGGRYNPIIVVDDEAFARHLIELFQVDALFPVATDERCQSFAKSIKHLPWPTFHEGLFDDSNGPGECTLLDIYHPVRKFHEEFVKEMSVPAKKTVLGRWSDNDACAVAFEARSAMSIATSRHNTKPSSVGAA